MNAARPRPRGAHVAHEVVWAVVSLRVHDTMPVHHDDAVVRAQGVGINIGQLPEEVALLCPAEQPGMQQVDLDDAGPTGAALDLPRPHRRLAEVTAELLDLLQDRA